MCYNVLCDKYATRQLYGYCPSWALSWDYRKKNIMQEILGCNADIISLQVSADLYQRTPRLLQREMRKRSKRDGSRLHLGLSRGVYSKVLAMDYSRGISVTSFLTGSGDGAVLQLLLAGAEGAGIRWLLQSKVPSQDHV